MLYNFAWALIAVCLGDVVLEEIRLRRSRRDVGPYDWRTGRGGR